MREGVFVSVEWLILLDLLFGKSKEDTMARQVNQVFRIRERVRIQELADLIWAG